jgi:hypothetical protein
VAAVHAHVAMLVKSAQHRGELPKALHPEVAAAAYWSFYYFALIGWVQGGHPAPLRLFQTMLRQHFGFAEPAQQTVKKRASGRKP